MPAAAAATPIFLRYAAASQRQPLLIRFHNEDIIAHISETNRLPRYLSLMIITIPISSQQAGCAADIAVFFRRWCHCQPARRFQPLRRLRHHVSARFHAAFHSYRWPLATPADVIRHWPAAFSRRRFLSAPPMPPTAAGSYAAMFCFD